MKQLTAHRRRAAGFSVVEVMVAIVIGLVLLAGVMKFYLSSKQAYRVQDAMSQLQDSERFAMQILAQDLRMAGAFGCFSGTMPLVNTLNNSTSYAYNFATGLQGYNANASGGWTPSLDPYFATGTPAPQAGSDVITIRRASGGVDLSPPWMNTTSAALHMDVGNGIHMGDILLVSDCSGAAVFQATTTNPDTSGTTSHNTGTQVPGNSTTNLGKIFRGDAQIARVSSISYYIAPSSAGNAVPSLWRRDGNNAPVEVAEGVADMQILYGEDTDGDRTANRYVTADQVGNMDHVVSLKVMLLLRTLEDNLAEAPVSYTFNGTTVTPTDKRLSRVFSSVITIRNRAL